MKLFAKKKTYILICDNSLRINAYRFALNCTGIQKVSVIENCEFCVIQFDTKKSFNEWCEIFYEVFSLNDMSWLSNNIIRVKNS